VSWLAHNQFIVVQFNLVCSTYHVLMLIPHFWYWVYTNTYMNIKWVRVFKLYKGLFRRRVRPGFFMKSPARLAELPCIAYKGSKYGYSLNGDLARLFITRARFRALHNNKGAVRYSNNSAIVIGRKRKKNKHMCCVKITVGKL
jgi:hypothetical protein